MLGSPSMCQYVNSAGKISFLVCSTVRVRDVKKQALLAADG
jgi:hypothetical protein